ncbi:MAG: exo-alpha-sialidase [Chloroflexus sp.]|uniref:exo-alpha-sialidase n=1 Tax=Chloroflexus sp. TaxID=1904827 RepID=UPI00309800A3
MSILVRTLLLPLCLLALIVGILPLATPSAAQSGAQLLVETILSDSVNLKFPQAATHGDKVYVIGIADSSDDSEGKVRVWTKTEAALNFPSPLTIGTTARTSLSSSYINSAITTSSTGEVLALWIDQAAKIVRFRKRDVAGNWGPAVEVTRSIVFPVRPALTIVNGGSQNGRIIAVWRDELTVGDPSIYYTFSDNGGASWAPVVRAFSMKVYASSVQLASGTNGEVVLTFTRDTPRPLHTMVALWQGSGFGTPVDVNLGDTAAYADSGVSIYNGKVYVGFRHVDNGIFYAEKNISSLFDNQPWSRTLILNGKGDGKISVHLDFYGNMHLSFIETPSTGNRRQNRLHYAVRLTNGTFLGPVSSSTSGPLFNAWGVSSWAGGFYMHVAHEFFNGDIPFLRYALFQAPGAAFGSRPLIENDVAVVGGDGKVTVNVTFPDLATSNLPDQVRWRWGAPPTDTENDSGGWQPFNPSGPTSVLTVPIPESLRTDAGCVERVLYTQLRRSENNLIDQVRSDAVIIDAGVLASATVSNPFSRLKTSPFTGITTADTIGEGGASDGHPDYTRVPAIYVELRSVGDCSGLQNFALAPNATALNSVSTLAISGNRFANILPYPDTVAEGPLPVVVRMRDTLGNSMHLTRTLIYDVTPPVLNGGTLQVQPIPGSATVIVNLEFSSIAVTDNLYPGRGFWGVWLANSRVPIADPANDPSLVWFPVAAPGDANSFSVVWSLASGLPEDQLTPGPYYVYARILDGAGNPSVSGSPTTTAQPAAAVLPAGVITLDQVTFPQVYVPLLSR